MPAMNVRRLRLMRVAVRVREAVRVRMAMARRVRMSMPGSHHDNRMRLAMLVLVLVLVLVLEYLPGRVNLSVVVNVSVVMLMPVSCLAGNLVLFTVRGGVVIHHRHVRGGDGVFLYLSLIHI